MFDDFPREFWPAMAYVLWRYDPASADAVATAYHWLNVTEAFAWFAVAVYVGRRLVRHRRAVGWESAYVLLFVVFGVSDLVESRVVPVWLIAAKGLIFAGIVAVRWKLVRSYYPDAKF
ncbi:MAG: hypothetical protein AAF710_09300 [Planctomycetota bacterium]